MRSRCICGCGQRSVADHHVIYQQELRRRWREIAPIRSGADVVPEAVKERWPWGGLKALLADPRNRVPVAFACHGAHHNRVLPLPVFVLPDEVFEFADQLLGAGAAYEYMARRYIGRDDRLEALLDAA